MNKKAKMRGSRNKSGERGFLVASKQTGTTESGDEFILIKGIANAYKDDKGEIVVDRDEEVILPEAYELDNFLKNPIALYQHKQDIPIGTVTEIEVTESGLMVEVMVFKDMNTEAYVGIKNGVLKAFSIGFHYKEGRWQEPENMDNWTWLWTKVELYEVSVVSIPANQDSIFEVSSDNEPCGGTGTCTRDMGKSTKETETKETETKETTKEGDADDGGNDTGSKQTTELDLHSTKDTDNDSGADTGDTTGDNTGAGDDTSGDGDGDGTDNQSEGKTSEEETGNGDGDGTEDNKEVEETTEPLSIKDLLADLTTGLPENVEDGDLLNDMYTLYQKLENTINASLEGK